MPKRLVAALVVSAVVAGCGTKPHAYYDTKPVTFSITTTTPTVTVPSPSRSPSLGPEGMQLETGPFLASATTTELGEIVDGIQCQSIEQHAYTAYAHLQVYVNGESRALPGGIGLIDMRPEPTSAGLKYKATTCQYWLSTSAADGIIHVESPVGDSFTLGQFFDIWNQPLSRNQVADNRGPVSVTVNGKPWSGQPQNVPLTEHEDIQLAVGEPVPANAPVYWLATGL